MPRPVRPSQPVPDVSASSTPSPGWLFFIGLLLAARYLQPTEAAIFGETLWQAQLWLVGAALWCWLSFRRGGRSLSFSPLDAFVVLIFVGHAFSTIPIFLEGGDRRAAVNVVWEWAGLAAMLFLVRQVLPRFDRARPVAAFASVLVGIAALGVWQHQVSFAETARRYDDLTSSAASLSALVEHGTATTSDRTELADVRRKLSDFNIPLDPSARRQWENRVKFSSEPFGTFGLANTLGGLLAAAIPILLMWVRWHGPRWKAAGLIAAIGVVFYCLLLTKSRTAWAGLVVGSVTALGLSLLRGRLDRRVLVGSVATVMVVVVAGVAVLASGGLDREVLSEAPKSLRYRLDYWTGTFDVLRERPILGTGPGNFRSHYLEHRPIGASEEIAAPHNLFLDIWTAGGLLSLLALIGLLGYVVLRTSDKTPLSLGRGAGGEGSVDAKSFSPRPPITLAVSPRGETASDKRLPQGVPSPLTPLPRERGTGFVSRFRAVTVLSEVLNTARSREAAEEKEIPAEVRRGWSAFEMGTLAAFPAVFFVFFISGAGFDWRLVAIAPIAAVALLCLKPSNTTKRIAVGCSAGFVALTVHLLGADGIEFPAVVQTLLLLGLALDRPRELVNSRTGFVTAAVIFAALATGCLLTGLKPVLNGGALTARAQAAALAGDPSTDRLLAEAIEADPFATTARRLRAELATSRAQSTGRAADVTRARREWEALLAIEPRSLYARCRLASLLLNTGSEASPSNFSEAARLLEDAVALSPTDVDLHVELARALEASDQPERAAEQAKAALELDRINAAAGHSDITLDDATRGDLERLSAVGKAAPVP
ncbi:MAG: O-antigen ligase family protein [Planctomycetaceae bacterium]|nr:O-antigen ligase family protein [Planctomycetaceae bacterium]